ncbi:hypothetical protein [Phenylobacterium sp.]|uniref:hypothetical protein n=1 Tax=Phenylobacterium sp. TaxID=1871053 RepID=UPI0035B418C9
MARVHIVGASASGTTTLGAALAARLGGAHLDTDAYFWEQTDPPFTTRRPPEARVAMMAADMEGREHWVVSGSMMGWGDVFVPSFDLAVFLYVPPQVRIARLLERERQRYGAEIEPGGRMHEAHLEFVEWARSYDRPGFGGRSLQRQRAWLETLPCPVLEISDAPRPEESLARVLAALPAIVYQR